VIVSTVLLLASLAIAANPVVQVQGGSGSAQRIQAAIDACPSTGCTIQLPDAEYRMETMLWILGRTDIRMVGSESQPPVLVWEDSLLQADSTGTAKLFRLPSPSGGGRPALPKGWLRWPLASTGGVGTLGDTTNPYSSSGYQRNGMFLVENSRRIVFQNLVLDGRKSAAFINPAVWNQLYPVIHGSTAFSLFKSQAVEISGCELRNFWAGVYISDRNEKCAQWLAPGGPVGTSSTYWTDCGEMGGHLMERNRIHDNWWGVYSEVEWDMGSVIRENLAWNNVNQLYRTGSTVAPAQILSNPQGTYPGGFLFTNDVVFPAHVVTNNTIASHVQPYSENGYRSTCNALWSDNLVEFQDTLGGVSRYGDVSDLFAFGTSPHLWNSVFLHHGSPVYGSGPSMVRVVDSTLKYAGFALIPRDTLHGAVTGAMPLLVPLDTFEEIVNGKTVRHIDFDTFSVLNDTVPRTADCGTGCTLPLVNPGNVPVSWSSLPLKAVMVPGWQYGRVKAPDSTIQYGRFWDTTVADSSGFLRLPSMDTSMGRRQGNRQCVGCGFTSRDPLDTGFLHPDWRSPRVLDAIGRGSHGLVVGAAGRDGRIGSQVPVRIRPRGIPTYDNVHGVLRLPFVATSERAGVTQLQVVRCWVSRRLIDPFDLNLSHPVEKWTSVDSVPAVSMSDSVIGIPVALSSTDSLVQVDLWMVGIAGPDTVAATPMSWAWSNLAAGRTFTLPTSITRRNGAVVHVHGVPGGLVLVGPAPIQIDQVSIVNAAGTTWRVHGQRIGDGSRLEVLGLPRGIWHVRYQGATVTVPVF
jgi:hypothetical protein